MMLVVIIACLIIIGACIVSVARKKDTTDITFEAVIGTYVFAILMAILSV